MNPYRRYSTRIVLLPIFLGALIVFLAACGTSGSPTTQGTLTPVTTSSSSGSASSPASTNTTLSTLSIPLQAIRMVDTSNGWALTTKNTVLKTSDGGQHWQDVTPKALGTGQNIQSEFLTVQVAWLAWSSGSDQPVTILHTNNGGANWQSAVINNITGGLAQDTLHFLNPQQGWLATSRAEGMLQYTTNIYRTTDSGQTWTNVSGPLRSTEMLGLSFSNPQLGWAGLQWPGSSVVIEKIVNSGQSWQQVQLPIPAGVNPQNIGQTQTTAPVLIGADGLLPAHLLTSSSSNTQQTRLALYTTHNSGATWIPGPLASFDSKDVYALDIQHLWAEETNSNILHFSSDGGKTWAQLAQTAHHFGALSIVDLNNGWAIDDAGKLYQTTNGGTSWQTLS